MCGIVAVLAQTGDIAVDALTRGRDALRHRGPDEDGLWLAADRTVGLAHTRLSIIDLATGQQPIANEDGSIVAVVNGEIYDFEALQRDLTARGHRLRSRSDSEVIVHLYEEYGAHALHHITGEYAFVLWDASRRMLLAARDRFGIKPLVYAVADGKLYLASEVKALFAAGVPARWDPEGVVHACYAGAARRTLYRGVHSVPPGGMLRATAGSLRVDTYWDFELPPAGAAAMSEADAIAGIRDKLDRAVRRRLRADVPVSVYLSGGLDSCAVHGLAAAAGCSLTGFTIAFEGDPQPEEACAREMAARCGSEIEPLSISQRMLADAFPAAVRAAETMLMNGHGVGKFLLSRLVRERGRKVVLTGEGADEMLAGYPAMVFDHLCAVHGSAQAALDVLRATNAASLGLSLPSGGPGSPQLAVLGRALGSVPGFVAGLAEAGAAMQGLFAGPAATLDPFVTMLEDLDPQRRMASRDVVARSLYFMRGTMLPTYLLTVLGDRMEMAHSVEGRVPFLDHELAEHVAQIPSALKVSGAIEKQLLRDAVRDLIPEAIYRRRKHPLRAPIVPAGPMWQLLHDLLRGPALAQLPFVDLARARALIDRDIAALDGPALNRHAVVLTRLASLCVLGEAFGVT